MKTLIYFNASDKPENMGQSQLTDSIENWLSERADILVDYDVTDNVLSFTKAISEDNEIIRGYALIFQVPNDFQN